MTLNIRIVLIKTWHAGNIGATARAMKNMGLSKLYLVDPVDYPSTEATSRAGQAIDVLDNAIVTQSLSEAIEDCSLVIGTSARDRSIPLPSLSAEKCAIKAVDEQHESNVAIVFGRERMGLHNEEIQQCHYQLNIDANPAYPVLNIGQAVQIVCYEIFKATQQASDRQPLKEAYPEQKELLLFNEHIEKTAYDIGFINEKHPGQTLDHLRSLFRRARLTKKELSIMRGFLNAIQKKAKNT